MGGRRNDSIKPDIASALRGQRSSQNVRKSGVWKLHILAYAAGLLFLMTGGVLFIVSGLPTVDDNTVNMKFTLAAPEASSVALVGDFNGWDTAKTPLRKTGEGMWQIDVRLKKGRVYTYNYVIDGEEWITDPAALINVDDGFGGESSLLKL
ncbi:MAG: isoamylase early set domain-containing protein [Spirochaetales bacterium]|nr:isoamylase early set domain-containing protein [Spirochaetales bacterium]